MDNDDDKATELLWEANFEEYSPAEVDFIEVPQRSEHSLILFNFNKKNKEHWDRNKPAA